MNILRTLKLLITGLLILPVLAWSADESKKFLRVVSLFQGATDTLVALNIEPVGVVESWVEKPMYKYLRDDLVSVKFLGIETQPSIEGIARLKPDVILATKFRHEKIYPMLSKIAPTVLVPKISDFKLTLKMVGEAVNKTKKAEKIQHAYDQRIVVLKRRLIEKNGENWENAVTLLNIRPDHVRIGSAQTFGGSILKELGFVQNEMMRDSTRMQKKVANYEVIPQFDADYFFMDVRSKAGTEENLRKWQKHPLWKQTKASKRGQIYPVNSIFVTLGGGILSANRLLDELEKLLLTE